ncbi:hypothetical protein [Aeromicrobium sp. CTD01-1L150]|uniref:hypothetical protein n=1 Tax=Aeromicrobium sp. CTD01-1L150 TaxID=3341830 RepID=UPI0035C2684F
MNDRVQDDIAVLRRIFLRLGSLGFLYSAVGVGLVWTGSFVAALVGSVLFVAGSLMLTAFVFGAPLVTYVLWDRRSESRRRTSTEEKRDG